MGAYKSKSIVTLLLLLLSLSLQNIISRNGQSTRVAINLGYDYHYKKYIYCPFSGDHHN